MTTRLIRWTRVVAAMVALLPTASLGQTPDARVATALERALGSGVPVALLESKIAEGKAKGVPMDRIAAAVERRLEVLQHVLVTIGEQHGLGAQELGLAADAVQSGVNDAVLEAIAASAPRDRRGVAIAALTQLVELGHASEEALARVSEAMERGPQALMELPAQAAAARGGPPDGVPGRGPPADVGSQGQGRGPPAGVPPTGQGRGRGGGGGG